MLKSQFATEEKNHNKIKIHKPSFIKPTTTAKRMQRRQIISNKTATVSEMMVKIIRCIGLFAIIITPCKRQSE